MVVMSSATVCLLPPRVTSSMYARASSLDSDWRSGWIVIIIYLLLLIALIKRKIAEGATNALCWQK